MKNLNCTECPDSKLDAEINQIVVV